MSARRGRRLHPSSVRGSQKAAFKAVTNMTVGPAAAVTTTTVPRGAPFIQPTSVTLATVAPLAGTVALPSRPDGLAGRLGPAD